MLRSRAISRSKTVKSEVVLAAGVQEESEKQREVCQTEIAKHDPVTYGLTFSFLIFFYGYFGARWYNSDDAVQITSILPSSPNVRQLLPVGRKNFLQA